MILKGGIILGKILNYLLDNWIAVLSLFISVATSLYTFLTNKMNLEFNIQHSSQFKDEYNNPIIVSCTINNKSQNNISINSIELKLNNKFYQSIRTPIQLGTISFTVFDHDVNETNQSIKLPLKLESYDSVNTSLLFPIPKEIIIPKKMKIIVYTSRGKKTLSVILDNTIN